MLRTKLNCQVVFFSVLSCYVVSLGSSDGSPTTIITNETVQHEPLYPDGEAKYVSNPSCPETMNNPVPTPPAPSTTTTSKPDMCSGVKCGPGQECFVFSPICLLCPGPQPSFALCRNITSTT